MDYVKLRLVILTALLVLGWGALVTTAPGAAAATVPDAPVAVVAVPGDRSMTVSWEPGGDGGSPITTYEISAGQGATPVRVAGDHRSVVLVSGLSNGVAYRAEVYAINDLGRSARYGWSNEVVPAGVPGPAYNLAVHARPDGATRVSWTPATPNGADVTSYALTTHPGGATTTIDAQAWATAPPDPDGSGYYWVDLRALASGVTHTLTVTATNSAGTGTGTSVEIQVAGSHLLLAGESLRPGEALVSANGSHRLVMQGDGNLVLYGPAGATWASWTAVPGTVLVMQSDGNLVAYAPGPRSVWASHTPGAPGGLRRPAG